MEFRAFPEIKNLNKETMQITQKIHGTNAQILIKKFSLVDMEEIGFDAAKLPEYVISLDDQELYVLKCGSRNRWITPEDDNFGFATFVYAHKEEFIRKLGPGLHFGEWAGPGINSGEGLKEKTFVLFDHWKYSPERPLPPRCTVVPVLYDGPIDTSMIEKVSNDLQVNGSKLVPGFMNPEGVVVRVLGTRFKKVFKPEETAWKKPKNSNKQQKTKIDYSHLLQPIRLEKLLSREERLLVAYPETLGEICRAYFEDLEKERQISGNPDELKAIRKQANGQVFQFVRTLLEKTFK